MNYLIAIDGGGTKTESILFQEDGSVLSRHITKGVNALDVGIECAKQRILESILYLTDSLPQGKSLSAIYGGLAASVDYYPGVMHTFVQSKIDCSHLRLEGDGGSLIAAMQGHSDGASLIAGTGSSLYLRSNDTLCRYGGWGPLIDTEGSGYKLGLHAFYAAFRSLDGRGPKTILYDLISEQMGAKPEDHLPELYEKGRPYISTFAQCVIKGRNLGDEVATGIFNHGIKCLSELVEIGCRELQKDFNVYTGGGLFSRFPEYWEALNISVPSQATLVPINIEPIYGAAVEALWNLSITPDSSFKDSFIKSYKAIVRQQDNLCGGNSSDFESIYENQVITR